MTKPPYASILVLISQLLASGPTFASLPCSAEPPVDHEVVLHLGQRTVTLIGWEHLGDESSTTLKQGLDHARAQAQAGHCSDAVQTARSTLVAMAFDYTRARLVLARLRQLHEAAPLSYIGVEMTPNELEDQGRRLSKLDAIFSDLLTLCGPDLTELANLLRVVAPGPEFEFNRLVSNVPVKALEDQTLKDANANDFDGAEQDTFDFSNPALTAEAEAALETIKQNVIDQVQPSENTIRRALSFEHDPDRKTRLGTELRFAIKRGSRILAGAYRRNVAIAASILNQSGNGAVPIGFSHVRNLVGELLRQCLSR